MESLYLLVSGGAGVRAQQGTAWLLWPDIVVTALHVVGTAHSTGQWAHDGLASAAGIYRLRLPSGRTVAAEPLVHDPQADVALLRLPEGAAAEVPEDAFAVLAPEPPVAGEPWSAAGYPAFEAGARALVVGGVVSRAGTGLTNDAVQLFVDQGTSAAWGGISGSAAQNAFGEVVGVVLQTVAGIATCNAARAEVVARLVRLLPERAALAAELADRIQPLGAAAAEEIAGALEWGWLPATPAFAASPAAAVAERAVQAGELGILAALAAVRAVAVRAGSMAASAPPDPLEARVRDLVAGRPDERDLVAVLDALADAGGSIRRAGELGSALPDMPSTVLEAALDRLHDRGHFEDGPRGVSAPIVLSGTGARAAIRLDYARAVLRALADGVPRAAAEIQPAAGLAPRMVRRTLAHALAMGLVEPDGGKGHLVTEAGRDFLAGRTVSASPPRDARARQ